MVEFSDEFYGVRNQLISVKRWTRRLFGIASLLAIPGIWIACRGAEPEARVMGLGLTIVLIGCAGLCLAKTR